VKDLEQGEEAVDDAEVVTMPPDVDEVTDEYRLENELIQTTMYDVATVLEVFIIQS
jgi:hypothetical protein